MKSGDRSTKQPRGSDGEEMQSEEESVKHSPKSHLHDKCIVGYEFESETKKTSKKKKPARKYPDEVVRFVEGSPDPEALWKNQSRKSPRYNTQIRFLEHKYIQCNIVRTSEDAEMILPEEIKPLLINVTFLMHESKQRPDSKTREEACGLISRIASLVAELSRRPIKRYGGEDDGPKQFDAVADRLGAVLEERGRPENEQYESLLREIGRLEQELIRKDSEVNYVREQIREERERFMPESTCLEDRLRNSVRKNQSLRAEIKYNRAQFRKYEKILVQKEQLRQKSLLELNNLRRKCARMEQSSDIGSKPVYARLPHADSDVCHGGSLTKYIKSKVRKKNIRSKVGKSNVTVRRTNQK